MEAALIAAVGFAKRRSLKNLPALFWRGLRNFRTARYRARGGRGRMGIGRMIERAGEAAGLPFPVHVHMLRHSTGYRWRLGEWTQGDFSISWAMLDHEHGSVRRNVAGAVQDIWRR